STLTTTGASALSASDPLGAMARAGDVARSGAHAASAIPQTASRVRRARAGTRRRVEQAVWRFERFMKAISARSGRATPWRRGERFQTTGKRVLYGVPDHAPWVTVGQQQRHSCQPYHSEPLTANS